MGSLLMKIASPFAVCVGIICSSQVFYIWIAGSSEVLMEPLPEAGGTQGHVAMSLHLMDPLAGRGDGDRGSAGTPEMLPSPALLTGSW